MSLRILVYSRACAADLLFCLPALCFCSLRPFLALQRARFASHIVVLYSVEVTQEPSPVAVWLSFARARVPRVPISFAEPCQRSIMALFYIVVGDCSYNSLSHLLYIFGCRTCLRCDQQWRRCWRPRLHRLHSRSR
jgi:hypothetical protein